MEPWVSGSFEMMSWKQCIRLGPHIDEWIILVSWTACFHAQSLDIKCSYTWSPLVSYHQDGVQLKWPANSGFSSMFLNSMWGSWYQTVMLCQGMPPIGIESIILQRSEWLAKGSASLEDITLSHIFWQILADSSGLRRTQILDWVGVTWANFGCLVQMESAGVHHNLWIPPDSLQWTPVDLNQCSIHDYSMKK